MPHGRSQWAYTVVFGSSARARSLMVSFSLERWLSVGSLGQRNLTVQRGADARTGGIVGWPIWPCRLSVARTVAVSPGPDSRYALPAPVCYAGDRKSTRLNSSHVAI